MEVYLKKYFGLVPVMVVAVCAYFTAVAVNHIVEAKALGDSSKIGKADRVVRPAKKTARLLKDGVELAKRNMFCSTCEPPAPEEDDVVVDSDHPPTTSLKLQLIATQVSTLPGYSAATVINSEDKERTLQGSYSEGQHIPTVGAIVRISRLYVDFENDARKRVERINLLSDKPASSSRGPREISSVPKPSSTKPKDELMAMVDEGVKKISDTEYEIEQKVVDQLLSNPMAFLKGVRPRQSSKGMKLYSIRPNSPMAKIGLKNGDTIVEINGFKMTSVDEMMKAYTKLRSATSLSVSATRRGKPVTMNYSIRN